MQPLGPKDFHVYMTASGPCGVIYVGISGDLPNRAWGHRQRFVKGFTTKYWAGRSVTYERHDDVDSAQHREYLMKRWRRDWKIELIEQQNPTWTDLFEQLVRKAGYAW